MLKNRIVLYALLLVFALLAAACNPGDTGDPTYALNVFIGGTGSGSVSSDTTIDCGATCEDSYETGTIVTLTALADEGYEFAGWSGETCAEGVNDSQCTLTMDAQKEITATFNLLDDPGPGPGPGPDPDPVTIEIALNLCEGDVGCNDAEEYTTEGSGGFDVGEVDISSSDLELNYDDGGADRNMNQLIGLRFAPTLEQIPADAVIDSAFIRFTPKASSDEDALTLTIKAQTDADPAEFTTADADLSGRSATETGVTWQPAPWLEDVAGEATETPDLGSLLTDIGWQAGNPIVFLIEGDGSEVTRNAVSSEPVDNDNPATNPNGPRLVITYTPGS